jgi:CHASE2 domain-containing sensor protein
MRVILAGTAVTVLVTALFLVRPDPIAKLDARAGDFLTEMAGGGRPSGRVAIVEIDEQSLAERGRWPWPRDLLGQLVRGVVNQGAATVVLDMLLHEEDRGAPAASLNRGTGDARFRTNDEALADALTGKPVVLGYVFRFDASPTKPAECELQPMPLAVVGPNVASGQAFFHAPDALCSVPLLSHAASAAGFLNAAPDSDGKLRRVPLVMEYGEQFYPSAALAAVNIDQHAAAMQVRLNARSASQLSVGPRVIPLEGPSSMRLRFRGPHRTFPYVSAAGVLNGRLPTGALQGKIVIVGGSAVGLANPVSTR